jgi:hypothetical protein
LKKDLLKIRYLNPELVQIALDSLEMKGEE